MARVVVLVDDAHVLLFKRGNEWCLPFHPAAPDPKRPMFDAVKAFKHCTLDTIREQPSRVCAGLYVYDVSIDDAERVGNAVRYVHSTLPKDADGTRKTPFCADARVFRIDALPSSFASVQEVLEAAAA